MPKLSASGPSPSAAGLNSSPMATSWPASSSTVARTSPGRVMASTGSAGTLVSASASTSPSAEITSRPTPAAPSRCGPLASGR